MTEKDVQSQTHALLVLQRQCVNLDKEQATENQRDEILQHYYELCHDIREKVQKSSKFTHFLLRNQDFYQSLRDQSCKLILPLLNVFWNSLVSHPDVPKFFIPKHPIVVYELVNCVKIWSEQYPGEEYDKDLKQVKKMLWKIISFLTEETPDIVKDILLLDKSFMNNISNLKPKRDEKSKVVLKTFEDQLEIILEEERKTDSAIKIQSFWRGTLQRRKWDKMISGFKNLQELYRLRKKREQQSFEEKLVESERNFRQELQMIVRNRERIEEQMRNLLMETFPDSSSAKPLSIAHKNDSALSPEEREKEAKVRAATIIQGGVRRWLVRKRNRRPIWSRNLNQTSLTETKVRRYKDEIYLWQQKNKAPPMNQAELQELIQKSQFQFARLCQLTPRRKMQDHKAMAKVAQSEAICNILEAAPKELNDYDVNDWPKYHSLPMHVATKARMDHKKAMERLEWPSWRRKLEEIL